MALAVVISKKIHRLGLIPKLIKLLPVLSIILAVVSVGWLLWLPLEGNYRTTYISENALMPAQATSYFRESEWNIVRGYREEVKMFSGLPLAERNAILESWLEDIGLKTAYHEGTLYAIMHAPRGDHTEAMVVAVPWETSDLEYNEGGVSIATALARYFKRMSIWSKNIIFVFPEDGHKTLRSWVEAYHTSLDLTGGSIDAAMVMEYGTQGDYFDYYEIAYEGLNGQLPNLDLMNTANLIGYHEGLKYSIQSMSFDETTQNTYWLRLRTLLRGIYQLALAGLTKPSNGCEAFSGWQIQAITIKARGSSGPPDVTQFGRIVDSTLRSVNNLLEKFHQSFFFYLMLSPKYFVSIGTYLPSAVLLALSFALASLSALFNNDINSSAFVTEIGTLLKYFTTVEIISLVIAVLPLQLTEVSDDLIALILLVFTFLTFTMSFMPLFNAKMRKYFRLSKTITYSFIALALFYIGVLIFALLIVHFSLALSIGLLALPLTWIQPIISSSQIQVQPSKPIKQDPISLVSYYIKSNNCNLKIALCLLCSSPFFSLYVIGTYLVPSLEETNGVIRLMRGLITSWNEFQCWTWFVLILGWFSSWLCVASSCIFGEFDQIKLKTQ